MTVDVTAQSLWDGTFSRDALESAALAVVAGLHDEAMAAIAALADGWARPVEDDPAVDDAVDDAPVTYRDPASWSVAEDEDDAWEDGDPDEDDEARVLPRVALPALPALPPRLRPGARVTPRVEQRPVAVADAATDEFDAPGQGDRRFAAV